MLPSSFDQPRAFQLTLKPGTYIFSATMLQSVYNRTAFGPWCAAYETEYQNLALIVNRLRQHPDMATFMQLTATGVIERYDNLRLGRLCAYLRKREPDERITYGILVYELNQAQLDEALGAERGVPRI